MPKLGMEIIRRRQVIDAVLHILSEQGWKDLTIREVSDVAGVSSGILAHYFGKKREMTIDSIAEAYRRYREMVSGIVDGYPNPVERLVALVDVMAAPQKRNVPGWSFWLAIDGRMPFDKVLHVEAQSHQSFLQAQIAATFDQGVKLRVFECARPTSELALVFLSLIHGLGLHSILSPALMSERNFRETSLKWLEVELGIKFQPQPVSLAPATPAGRRKAAE